MVEDSEEVVEDDYFDRQLRSICQAVGRFPLAICFIFALTSYLIFHHSIIIDFGSWAVFRSDIDLGHSKLSQQKISLVICVGIPWFTLMAIAAEAHRWRAITHYVFAIAIYICFCAYVYFSAHSLLASVLMLLFALLLLFPCAPWLFRVSNNMAFWNFSYHLTVNAGQLLVETLSQLKYAFFAVLVIALIIQPIIQGLAWLAPVFFILISCLYLPINFLAMIPTGFDSQKRQGDKVVNLIILLRGSIYVVLIAFCLVNMVSAVFRFSCCLFIKFNHDIWRYLSFRHLPG